jgi:hypothetical protein
MAATVMAAASYTTSRDATAAGVMCAPFRPLNWCFEHDVRNRSTLTERSRRKRPRDFGS